MVVPTDTVYGLAALPTSDAAVRSVYRIKQRPRELHLPVLAASIEDVRGLGVKVTAAAEAFAAGWWPGPLTMAFGFDEGAARPDWLATRTEVAVQGPGPRASPPHPGPDGAAVRHERQPAWSTHTRHRVGRGDGAARQPRGSRRGGPRGRRGQLTEVPSTLVQRERGRSG